MSDQPAGCFQKVLLATDGSHYSNGARSIAVEMCRQSGAELHIVSAIIRGVESSWMGPQADAEAERAAADNLKLIAASVEQAGVRCATHLEAGDDPYKVIVDTSKKLGVDIVVMGRRGRRGLARLMLGDATAKVIGYAPCTVLVVPEESKMWTSVLVATDGSQFGDAAVAAGGKLAKCSDMPLKVLSVKVPTHSERRQNECVPDVERSRRFLREHGIEAEGIVESGLADEVILTVAERVGAGLIVLGNFGRTGIGRVLFGTKAERVINHTKCPVMVVRGA